MAMHLGHETRFPSLVLNTNSQTSPSYTENGSMIPAENSAMKLFTRLFVNDTPAEQERQAELIRQGRSVMDVVGAEAKSLQRELGAGDRDKLDAWFTSVRELEQRLAANESWTHKPKPKVALAPPTRIPRDNEVEVDRIFLDIVHMALATDSTRFITLHITGNSVQGIEGVDESYHTLSHHGLDDDKLRQLDGELQAVLACTDRTLGQTKRRNRSVDVGDGGQRVGGIVDGVGGDPQPRGVHDGRCQVDRNLRVRLDSSAATDVNVQRGGVVGAAGVQTDVGGLPVDFRDQRRELSVQRGAVALERVGSRLRG
jgi:hypothetical protein